MRRKGTRFVAIRNNDDGTYTGRYLYSIFPQQLSITFTSSAYIDQSFELFTVRGGVNVKITNAGTILNPSSQAIYMEATGETVTNLVGGHISGSTDGIIMYPGFPTPNIVTVVNAGYIGGGNYGVKLENGSLLTNPGLITAGVASTASPLARPTSAMPAASSAPSVGSCMSMELTRQMD
jgi:hypothetical protein